MPGHLNLDVQPSEYDSRDSTDKPASALAVVEIFEPKTQIVGNQFEPLYVEVVTSKQVSMTQRSGKPLLGREIGY